MQQEITCLRVWDLNISLTSDINMTGVAMDRVRDACRQRQQCRDATSALHTGVSCPRTIFPRWPELNPHHRAPSLIDRPPIDVACRFCFSIYLSIQLLE
jgi:hypothetical protein